MKKRKELWEVRKTSLLRSENSVVAAEVRLWVGHSEVLVVADAEVRSELRLAEQ
jgi:hypothetical protein